MRAFIFVTVPVVLSSAVALAQPGAPAMAPPPPPAPTAVGADPLHSGGFINGDRFDMNNRIGVEASYAFLSDRASDQLDSGKILGFDLHGSYIDRASGFGGYASLPLAMIAGSDSDAANTTAIGNLQVGVLLAKPLSPEAGIIVRAGAILPTAADDDFAKFEANMFNSYRRITDISLGFPSAKGLRLSASPMFRSGNVFGRVDAGVDLLWSNEPDAGDDDRATIIRLNAGVGVDVKPALLMAEVNYVHISESGGDDDGDGATNLAVSARIPSGQYEPYFGVVIPTKDAITDAVKAFITIGIDFRLD